MKFLKFLVVFFSIFFFMLFAFAVTNSKIEPKVSDYMVKRFSAQTSGSSDIVIVTIDDKSLATVSWPWKRTLHAKVLNYFDKYTDVKVIGYDAVILSENPDDIEHDNKFYEAIAEMDKLVAGFSLSGIADQSPEAKNYTDKFWKKFRTVYDLRDKKIKDYNIFRSNMPYPEKYFEAVQRVGNVNVIPNTDGIKRYSRYLTPYNGKLYPSLAFRMYLYLNNDTPYTIHPDKIVLEEFKTTVKRHKTGLLQLEMGKEYGVTARTHYYKLSSGHFSHKNYSAIDIIKSYDAIMEGKEPIISPEEFKGKIVFYGAAANATAMGLSDLLRSPISEKHSGVDINATELDNLIHNEYLKEPSALFSFFFTLLVMFSTFLIIKSYPFLTALSTVTGVLVLYLILCALSYHFDFVLNVTCPIVMSIITMIFAYSYRFIQEGKNKEKIKQAMGKYISNDIMQNVVKNIDELKLGGKRAIVTVLFADIRGFTSMSENMSAEDVSIILNEYFTEIEPIITKYNGVINKFIGDAVMAIFGEPIQDSNHATNAIRCANEMLLKVSELQKKWLSEGKPKIEIGIGINTGEVFVGNIGSEVRMEYTVIGDTVNLASRLESYNKVYQTSFLISNSTYNAARKIIDVIKISEVSIRGKANKMNIYEVLRVIE